MGSVSRRLQVFGLTLFISCFFVVSSGPQLVSALQANLFFLDWIRRVDWNENVSEGMLLFPCSSQDVVSAKPPLLGDIAIRTLDRRMRWAIALSEWRAGNCNSAVEALQGSATDDALSQFWLGAIYLAKSDTQPALDIWRRIGVWYYLWNVGRLARQRGDHESAIRWLRLAAAIEPTPQAIEDLSKEYLHEGRRDDVRALWARWVSVLSPDMPDYWRSVGYIAELDGKWQEAFEAYQRGIVLGPNDMWLYRHAREAAENLRDWDAAIVLTQKMIPLIPNQIWWLYLDLSYYALAKGEFSVATEWARKALVSNDQYDDLYWQAYMRLGQISCAQQRYGEAEAYYDKALVEAGVDHNSTVSITLAGCLGSQGRIADAIAVLKRSEVIQPQGWPVRMFHANLCQQVYDYACAREQYEAVLAMDVGQSVRADVQAQLKALIKYLNR